MKETKQLTIRPLSTESIPLVNDANDPFPIIGRIVPQFSGTTWSYTEERFETIIEIRFPDDRLDWATYIDNKDRIVLLAFSRTSCIGQIRLVRDWNRFAYIENIAVKQAFRKLGVGHQLLAAATKWAQQRELIGLSLEAQDDNLIACRFYAREGFVLGGVDSLKQSANSHIDLTLYWYKLF